jgi:molybdopterin converting factor small subunit
MPKETADPTPAKVTVVLPSALVALFPGSTSELEVAASCVRELFDALDARWPGMRDRLCDSTPAVRRHINVFVDGRHASLKTRLPAGTEVYILPAMSGG